MSDDCRYCFSDNWYYTLDFSVLWLRPRCFRFRSINLRLIIHFYFVSLQTQPATSLSPDPEPKTHLNLLTTQKAIFWTFISIKTHFLFEFIVSDFWWWWGREGSWDGEAGGVVWRHVGAFWILNKCQKRNFNPIKIQNMSCGFKLSDCNFSFVILTKIAFFIFDRKFHEIKVTFTVENVIISYGSMLVTDIFDNLCLWTLWDVTNLVSVRFSTLKKSPTQRK